MKVGVVVLALVVTSFSAQSQTPATPMEAKCRPFATLAVAPDGVFIWPQGTGARECWGAFQAVQELGVLREDDRKLLDICAPERTSRIETIRIFLKYGEKNPRKLQDLTFGQVVLVALREAYPCPKR